MKSDIAILGGGIAGLSLASFLNSKAIVLEQKSHVGGLSRSYTLNRIPYDIGPHIIFSKNKSIVELHTTMIEANKIRRSNQIFYKGRYIKYPFENDLGSLDFQDRTYCLKEFLSNPYECYKPTNMLQVFLSLFGEGITRLYLQPYNEKIWKFDPSFMDTQMVDRIPKPPAEDVLKSANGISTEGYTHQLHFHYPKSGGFQSLVNAYHERALARGQRIKTNVRIDQLERKASGWNIHTNQGVIEANHIVNCMPLQELFQLMPASDDAKRHLGELKYNSIYIVVVQVIKDTIGNHFAIYVPDKDIIYHRISKLNFLGDTYTLPNGQSTLLAEVTFRPGSYLASLPQQQIVTSVIEGMVRQGFIALEDVLDTAIRFEPYAYVIYDLNHRRNVDYVLAYLDSSGINSAGRFARFEYLNTDGVVEQTLKLADLINNNRPYLIPPKDAAKESLG